MGINKTQTGWRCFVFVGVSANRDGEVGWHALGMVIRGLEGVVWRACLRLLAAPAWDHDGPGHRDLLGALFWLLWVLVLPGSMRPGQGETGLGSESHLW